MMKSKEEIGHIFISNEGCKMVLIEKNGWYKCTVMLEDGNIIPNLILGHLRAGKVRNPFTPRVFGVGFMGVGEYTAGKKHLTCYNTWHSMMQRCYDPLYHKIQPTYIGCTIDERWHNYQTFAKYYYENYIKGWQHDKDLLIEGNKIYSPETCRFVPKVVNSIFCTAEKRGKYPIGVKPRKSGRFQAFVNKWGKSVPLGHFDTVKEASEIIKLEKEAYVKEVANTFKKQLDPIIYNKLMNYEMKIID